MRSSGAFIAIVGLTLALAAAACSSAPPPPAAPPPGVADVEIRAASDINPDAAGRPSPVMVRVYELGGDAKFQQADYFELADTEAVLLGPDLVRREDVPISPGEERHLTLRLAPGARFIAVAVAYRDIDRAGWRAAIEVPPHGTTKLQVRLEDIQVTLAKAQS
jgi:type VI secretion system protein VasD